MSNDIKTFYWLFKALMRYWNLTATAGHADEAMKIMTIDQTA